MAQYLFIKNMHEAPIALLPEKANQQHYEIPTAFFHTVLSSHKKYSCCYWPEGVDSLDVAEHSDPENSQDIKNTFLCVQNTGVRSIWIL